MLFNKEKTMKRWLVFSWSVLPWLCLGLMGKAFAAEGGVPGAEGTLTVAHGLLALAAALGMGMAIVGGAYGQSKMAAAAFEGTARNPEAKIMGFLLLSMAFVESLVLLAFVCMFLLVQKI
jgi:F-type H+-transporting ATPase subunit c